MKGVLQLLKNRILLGLMTVIPVGVSIWLVLWFLSIMPDASETLASIIPILEPVKNDYWFRTLVQICFFVILLCVLFLVGTFAKYTIAKNLLAAAEYILLQVPLIRSIYSIAHQIVDTIKSSNSTMFGKVVLLEYPRKGLYMIGFMTNDNSNGCVVEEKTGRKVISVFLPTTPNPTSGFLVFVPEDECTILDMPVPDAMKLIISGGGLRPASKNDGKSENKEI